MPDAAAQIRDRVRELRRVPASELRASPANWRTHPPAQQRALTAMLDRIGFAGAVLARETPDGLELIDGHLRAEIAREEDVPVLVLDVTEEEARLLLATIDPLSAMAEADGDKLAQLLEGVEIDQADLEKHLVRFMAGGTGGGLAGADPDEVPDVLTERSEPGSLWTLGAHRLLCGDARSSEDVDLLMAGAKADLIVTDPPYNVDVEGGTADKLKIANDALPAEEFEAFLIEAMGQMHRVAAPGAPAYVFHADGNGDPFRAAFAAAGWDLKQILIWVKQSAVMSRQDYNWQHEPILYGWKPGAAHPWFGPATSTTLIDKEIDPAQMRLEELVAIVRDLQETSTAIREDRPTRSREHPTMKPVKLLSRLMNNSSRARAIVLDTFAGSGSTLIAAEQMGRRCYALELSPHYCDVIVSRWQQFTGREPELAKAA
jgi:DNA modification methylase